MAVEARFTVTGKSERLSHGSEKNVIIELEAIMGKGNENWSKYTPVGKIEMTVTNPDAIDKFVVGDIMSVIFRKARNV